MSIYNAQRDPRQFSDPEKFEPQRFSPQNSVGRHPSAYITFGIGRRMCVGHVFVTMEAKTNKQMDTCIFVELKDTFANCL